MSEDREKYTSAKRIAELLLSDLVEEEIIKRQKAEILSTDLWSLTVDQILEDRTKSLADVFSEMSYKIGVDEHHNRDWKYRKNKYKITESDIQNLTRAGMDNNESTKSDESPAPQSAVRLLRRDYATLSGSNWLNDEVINSYLSLVVHRINSLYGSTTVFAFGTHFFMKLIHSDCDFTAVQRWTRKVDIFNYDMLLLPCNLTNHWGLAVVDFRGGRIAYFDSIGISGSDVVHVLIDFLSFEYMKKKGKPKSFNHLDRIVPSNIPVQENSHDCGVFLCQYCNCLMSRKQVFPFTQKDIPYLRQRMGVELLIGKVPMPL